MRKRLGVKSVSAWARFMILTSGVSSVRLTFLFLTNPRFSFREKMVTLCSLASECARNSIASWGPHGHTLRFDCLRLRRALAPNVHVHAPRTNLEGKVFHDGA